MPAAARRSNVRRSNVTACARCKARKQRCDQNLPACANCERAGVDCVGHDVDGSLVPRSYLKSLEDRVAHLEQQLDDYRRSDTRASPAPATNPQPGRVEDLLGQASFVSIYPSTFPSPRYMGPGSGLPLLRLLLQDIQSTTSFGSASTVHPIPSSILDQLPHEIAAFLPAQDVSRQLIDAYFEHCGFFSPILYRAEVLRMLEASDESSVEERYTLFMVLAVAIQLLNRTDSSLPAQRADAYFSAALRLLLDHPAVLLAGDLRHLEDLLLLVQYTCFSSSLTGAWHVIGLATRLAVDLGLHDHADHLPLDPLTLDRRKRLFWATYTFERNLCAVLGRPVSIPDESIFVSLPSDADDEFITATVRSEEY
ncbi:Fungal specific transcription factor domain containing protein [Neofusicoccum parvum]|nr:Fungal specific transcription factor domain containing protein [Neofusicoccum parvum]